MPDEQRSSISAVALATSSGRTISPRAFMRSGNAARVGERGKRIGLVHDDPAEQRAGRPGLGEMQACIRSLR